MIRKCFNIKGTVQGVGFRPFVCTTAQKLNLAGCVTNSADGVIVEVEGDEALINHFEKCLYSDMPPLARIDSIETVLLKVHNKSGFKILQSPSVAGNKTALIPPDIAICSDCLADVNSTVNQKYRNYFATNCTNCGPRYSIIKTVPYDRANSAMNSFTMCPSCQEEYDNPDNRRYHAQPISCNYCGPKLSLWQQGENLHVKECEILPTVANAVKEGKIIAIKGIGGFHIVCDATIDEVVQRLRRFKNRPSKPFALMCRDKDQVEKLVSVSEKEAALLQSKEAPIVILKKRDMTDESISKWVAPQIDRLGCFLPYTALHHLFFKELDHPIVATSANVKDTPIITARSDIFRMLPFVQMVLDFNREIINRVDDSVVHVVGGTMQMLRLGRGYAPKVIKLPHKIEEKILAVGAHSKNSMALAMSDTIIISPHIGDLESVEAFEYFNHTIATFQRFYNFEPDLIVHDNHPKYMTTAWAKKQGKKLIGVQHHVAHIYACKAEFLLTGDCLGFSFDGTGYGDESALWGGEVFVGDKRKYSFKPIKLLGASKAIKEPRRVALSLLFDHLSFDEVLNLELEVIKAFSSDELKVLYQSHQKNLNAPLSSSVGRLFDAVASLSGLIQKVTYEGESGLLCERYYDASIRECFDYGIDAGKIEIKMVEMILQTPSKKEQIISMLINTLVAIIVDIAKQEQLEVILSGGVFQNKTLLEHTMKALEKEGIRYYHQQETPINDGGIALGQLYYALCHKDELA